MTRKERFKLSRERAEIDKIGGEGVALEIGAEFRCDKCGEPAGTLYAFGSDMLCLRHVPFEYAMKSMKLIPRAASGREAIHRSRIELAKRASAQ